MESSCIPNTFLSNFAIPKHFLKPPVTLDCS